MTMTLETDTSDQTSAPIGLADVRIAGCGVLMGAADIVPGVSGGTVALILGIYHRLVTAVSQCNREFVSLVLKRQWKEAAEHIDLRFLAALGTGIVSGIGGLAFLMHYLLEHQAQHTSGVFFGLILGSGIVVAKAIPQWDASRVAAAIGGTVAAYFLVGLDAFQNPPSARWYYFVTGMVAICAMILPGISGAFIMLVLGIYKDVTTLLRAVLKGDWAIDNLLTVAVFCMGCLTGLLTFSRLLKWLLGRYVAVTMAALCGLMLGSLRKIWPFKVDLTPDEPSLKLKRFANTLPDAFDSTTMVTIGLSVFALGAVILLEAWSTKRRENRTENV